MKLDLLTNATVVDDAIRFVSQKSKEKVESTDKKVQILYKINSLLPKPCCINIPSLITDDYIDTALYRIEENIHSIIASP
jgi:hypothetical protein